MQGGAALEQRPSHPHFWPRSGTGPLLTSGLQASSNLVCKATWSAILGGYHTARAPPCGRLIPANTGRRQAPELRTLNIRAFSREYTRAQVQLPVCVDRPLRL